ncbi:MULTISPECIES: NADH-quinone oxidoreductase subunit NuoH [Candidatus Ichthyocystis]|uniref:NADH-quinone oxidoreductase subunit H n=1 Tax=Candidatus Ichthyocystis hellenicum TaxID=1561003 RepID=A0A0S4M2D6_9BURK|nr:MULTISPECIES: NADH-quinone oxidoreductase subunit NuoH [Ichthyocystis]CUT17854.1 NADH-quinone oxidoreductase subunit H [Candidatus Ichthyocystis hellenicum]
MFLVEWIKGLVVSNLGADVWSYFSTFFMIVVLVVGLLLSVAYLTYFERKIIGAMQCRLGPNRVGPLGLLQPIADVVKLLGKEVLTPSNVDLFVFRVAPVIAIMASIGAWGALPFGEDLYFTNLNAGLLYVLAITSFGVYGIILAGWSSNSRYAFLGAIRSAAQVISYEIALGFSLVCVLLVSGSLNFRQIVSSQMMGWGHDHGMNFLSWNWISLFPVFLISLISGIAETNRHPFDVAEGESELVAGFHVEYSGMPFAVFFLAEYANMILVATIISIMFLGGWDSPLSFLHFIPGVVWMMLKVVLVLFVFIWVRATLPRYRYDQIMQLGWKVFLPITVVCVIIIACWILSPLNIFHFSDIQASHSNFSSGVW